MIYFMSSTANLDCNPLIAFSEQSAEIVANVGKSIVAVNGQRFPCSGIHWRKGLIVTSAESLKRTEGITVTLTNGETAPITLLGKDASTDIAVFQIEADLSIAPINSECELKVGHLAIAIGRDSNRGLCVAHGVVSTVGGTWRSSLGGSIDYFIRLDLNLYPGGGSALVNATGQVVGFNTTGPRRSVLTIPAVTVDRACNRLLEAGHINRGYLGVGMQPVTLPESLTGELPFKSDRGLMIVNVETQSPAQSAGIILGDILVAIEDTPVTKLKDIQAYLEPQNVGKTIKVELIRAGKFKDVALTISNSGK